MQTFAEKHLMVAFNFGDASNRIFQSFDVNWFRFAKSCMLLDPFEECVVIHISNEILKLVKVIITLTENSSASSEL